MPNQIKKGQIVLVRDGRSTTIHVTYRPNLNRFVGPDDYYAFTQKQVNDGVVRLPIAK